MMSQQNPLLKGLPQEEITYYDWVDEIEDPLYICTGDCHNWTLCPLKDVHTEDEWFQHSCADYEQVVLDGMVGEHIYQHVENERKLERMIEELGRQARETLDNFTWRAITNGTSVHYNKG